MLPEMPGLITDFVLSLDDRYLYLVNWLHGDIRQYNIEDPAKPVLAGQVFVGGLLQKGSDAVFVTDDDKEEQYTVPQVKVSSVLFLLNLHSSVFSLPPSEHIVYLAQNSCL
jgi:selenium-binding protein 1